MVLTAISNNIEKMYAIITNQNVLLPKKIVVSFVLYFSDMSCNPTNVTEIIIPPKAA
ncbi:hypothetical protein [Methanococcus maripaludis]|uniref:hypothetical protein n=1 Tax=Methanococcus maripaludis TaxID=39152 RepID=UPI0015EB8256|nr:hypothetical protein [Methanococcus maripaludis]